MFYLGFFKFGFINEASLSFSLSYFCLVLVLKLTNFKNLVGEKFSIYPLECFI